jgi:Ca2+/Na+ antiporter
MLGDVLKLIVVWVFTIVGIVFIIKGIKSETHKIDRKNLILTLFLLVVAVISTIDFIRTWHL